MIFLCFLQLKTESTASWLLIRCIIYCITYHTHGKVMWINLSLACQNVCVLLAELAALPSAYFLLGPGAFLWKWCKLKSLFAENTAEVFKLIFKVVSRMLCASVVLLWRWGVCWRCCGHLEETWRQTSSQRWFISTSFLFSCEGAACPLTLRLSITSTVFIGASPPSCSSEASSIFQYGPLNISVHLSTSRGVASAFTTTTTTKSLEFKAHVVIAEQVLP